MALAEVEDALAVYAETNAFGELLRGEPLNLEVPPPQSDAALWSERRLVDRAVIRTFKPGGGEAQVQVEAWPGHPVTLLADGNGRTYVASRADGCRGRSDSGALSGTVGPFRTSAWLSRTSPACGGRRSARGSTPPWPLKPDEADTPEEA